MKPARFLLGLFFIVAGAFHFVAPEPYLRVMPPALPDPRLLVQLSGAAESALGALVLFERTAPLAGWGLVALLIAVFPANLYMLAHPALFPKIPHWILWARLPLQGLFIIWAYRATRPVRDRSYWRLFGGVVILSIACALAGTTAWLLKNSRAGVESPVYRVVERHGSFEIRDYPAFQQVRTPMTGGRGGSFMRLFHYISGQNAQAEKIAMTTPVLMGEGWMSFIVPQKTAQTGIPAPRSAQITVEPGAAARFAVLRFSGNPREAAARLQTWVEEKHLPSQGQPLFAYYDPPWTSAFLRRNEVLLQLRLPTP